MHARPGRPNGAMPAHQTTGAAGACLGACVTACNGGSRECEDTGLSCTYSPLTNFQRGMGVVTSASSQAVEGVSGRVQQPAEGVAGRGQGGNSHDGVAGRVVGLGVSDCEPRARPARVGVAGAMASTGTCAASASGACGVGVGAAGLARLPSAAAMGATAAGAAAAAAAGAVPAAGAAAAGAGEAWPARPLHGEGSSDSRLGRRGR
mmetsp:Transcript_109375/g.353097  ORF Transcript_109375/g.353097 Transcript_109375/m.353097 type:complete len:206 (+) Transcript_109375:81-698(+)